MSYFLPSQRVWNSLTKVPHVECSNFGCAVLNNNIFVVGGCFDQMLTAPIHAETIHPFGFKYDPLCDAWSSIAPMLRERCRFTLTPVGTKHLYAIGGSGHSVDHFDQDQNDDFQMLDAHIDDLCCEVFDVESNVWYAVASLPCGDRSQHAACSLRLSKDAVRSIVASSGFTRRFSLDLNDGPGYEEENVIVVSGGLDSAINNDHPQEILDTMILYRIQNDSWFEMPRRMARPRADHTMLVHNGQILIIGGWTEQGEDRNLVKEIDLLDIENNIWKVETYIPTPRYHAGIGIVQGKLYIVGGFTHRDDRLGDRNTGLVECYDLTSQAWEEVGQNPPEAIWEHVCQSLFVPIKPN